MPVYSYTCKCGKVFDQLHTSFGAAEREEAVGVICPKCGTTRTKRNTDPTEALKGGAFRKYGLHTYS